jgi:putative ABC transport system ATP-binding protein
MAEPILRIEGVRIHSPEGRDADQLLDWGMLRGQKVRIHAESGGGVSELLRLAAGISHPDEGRVFLDDIALGPYDLEHPFLKRGALAWIPPAGGLLVNQDLLTNIMLPLRFVRGMENQAAEELARTGLEEAGLGALARLRPHVMEVRERWLATLVRASVMDPELWLVDRPASELDRRTRKSARRILDQVAQRAETTLMVVGEGGWIPEPMEALKFENGLLVPEVLP